MDQTPHPCSFCNRLITNFLDPYMVAMDFKFCSPECCGEQLTPCNPDWSHHEPMVNEVTIIEEDEPQSALLFNHDHTQSINAYNQYQEALTHMQKLHELQLRETFEQFDERISNLEKAVYLIHKVLGIMTADTIKGVSAQQQQIEALTQGVMTFNELRIKGIA